MGRVGQVTCPDEIKLVYPGNIIDGTGVRSGDIAKKKRYYHRSCIELYRCRFELAGGQAGRFRIIAIDFLRMADAIPYGLVPCQNESTNILGTLVNYGTAKYDQIGDKRGCRNALKTTALPC